MISGACSDLSVSTYSIPFSSQTMRTAHVYVERAEPMISGFGMPFLRFCRPVTFTGRSKAAPTCDVNLFGGKLAKVGSQFRVKNKTPSSKRSIPLLRPTADSYQATVTSASCPGTDLRVIKSKHHSRLYDRRPHGL